MNYFFKLITFYYKYLKNTTIILETPSRFFYRKDRKVGQYFTNGLLTYKIKKLIHMNLDYHYIHMNTDPHS